MDKAVITITNEKNEQIKCNVLFTFENEETKKNYIVYTDNSKDKDGNVQVFASIYDPNQENSKLEEIKTEKEWKIINNILNSLHEKEGAK